MAIHNTDIAEIFDKIADLLEIEQANPFRVRAYRNASREIRSLGREAKTLLEQGEDLTRLPGIGKDLAAKIKEIVETGKCQILEKLLKKTGAGLIDILHISGLGPKRVGQLYHELDIHNPKQLYRVARAGKLRELPGFGEKTELNILEALEQHIQQDRRFKFSVASEYAQSLVEYLGKSSGIDRVTMAGSYRRAKETVGDLDILVTAMKKSPVMQRFVDYEDVKEVLSKGTTRSSVVLRNGLQVDLRVVPKQSYGAALHYFTGSKAHNITIRRRAQKRGLKINEYGVFKDDKQIAGRTEESVFKSVGLPWIAPELRENNGEIEAASANMLPDLVEYSDLKGDLHMHTKATDGNDTIKDMAMQAKKLGLKYIAITDHSKRLTVAHGLDQRRLLKQIEEIDEINEQLRGITVLKGIEVDILEDGRLDLPDNVLSRLDLVIAAVHSKFHLSRAKQTKRILKAMDHPHFTILAHPSGRLLQQREAYDVDLAKIIRHARQRDCFLELNSQPDRLDLTDTYCRMAKDEGVLLAVNSDAHSVMQFNYLHYGIGQARRGWLEKKDIMNTRPLAQLQKLLKKTM